MNRLTYFQASQLKDEEVIEQFVVRKLELDIILSSIRSEDMSGSIQHYVIIGQRGSGKSTLLRRLQAEVATDVALSKRLVAVNLSEEQAGIYRLHDLWNRVEDELREQNIPVKALDWERIDNDLVEMARVSYKNIQEALTRSGRKLLLLLDNIDRIFENLTDQEARLFRELLMNHKDLRIVGGSTRLSEHHWKYDRPFYEFFRVLRLEPLGSQELRDLLISWSDRLKEPAIRSFVENHGGRLEALRILSDGMPRTMLHLLELLIQKPEDNGFDYLHRIVDRATPIYQERLIELTSHQRKVLLELSFFWASASAKQLSETARMDTRTLSAVLKKLADMRIVETVPRSGKNHLYRVKERFFNLWLIMTQGGPRQKRRVQYLTIFLEIWYGREGLPQLLSDYRGRLKSGAMDAGQATLMTTALARSSYISAQDRDELIGHTQPISATHKEFANSLPPTSEEACNKMQELLVAGRFQEAIEEASELEQETSNKNALLGWAYGGLGDLVRCSEYLEKALKLDQDPLTLVRIGIVHSFIKDYEAAEQFYLRAIDKGHVGALYNLANLYRKTGKAEKAEQFYLRAIEKGRVDALNNLANLYNETGKLEQAEPLYLRAIEKGHVHALYNLANLYMRIGKAEQAEQFYLRAIDKGHVGALFNLAILYQKSGKSEQAEQFYLRAIDKDIVEALNNLANLYSASGKTEQAEQFYLRAIDKGHVKALNNLANHYRETGRADAARAYYVKAMDHGDADAMFNLAYWLYLRAEEPQYGLDLMQGLAASKGDMRIKERCLLALLKIWVGRPEDAEQLPDLISEMLTDLNGVDIAVWPKEFLVHYQTNQLWNCFTSEDQGPALREQLQPLYFATAKLVGKAGEDAMRVMPTELASTVDDIVRTIEEERKRYYPQLK